MTLEVKNITFSFNGRKLFESTSAVFEKSKIYAIVGPNGSGKTTFLKILLSLIKPNSGSIIYEGKEIKSFSHLHKAKTFAYLPQIPCFNPEETLWEIVRRGEYPHKRIPPPPRPLSLRKEIAEKYLELENLWNRKMETLSGGEVQRGIISRIIIQDSPVMVFDEPLNHLDLRHRLKLFELFEKMKQEGKIIIYAVHDFNMSLEYDHHILVIDKKGNLKQLTGKEGEIAETLRQIYGVDFKIAKTENKFYYFPFIRKE